MGYVPLPPPPLSAEARARVAAAALDREVQLLFNAPASEAELLRWHEVHDDARLAGVDEDECCQRADADQKAERSNVTAQLSKEADEWREKAKPQPPQPGGLPAVAGGQIERESRRSGATMATEGRCGDCERARGGVRWRLLDPATPIRVSTMGGPDQLVDIPNWLEVFLTPDDLERAAREKQFGGVAVDHNGVINVKFPDGRMVAGQLHHNAKSVDANGNEAFHFTIVAHG